MCFLPLAFLVRLNSLQRSVWSVRQAAPFWGLGISLVATKEEITRALGPTKDSKASAPRAGSAGEVRRYGSGRSPASGILFPTLLFHVAVH